MKRLQSRRLEFRSGRADFFGSVQVAGKACYFLAVGDHRLALFASLDAPANARPFARGQQLAFEYRRTESGTMGARATSVLEGFVRQLLQAESRIVKTLNESHDGPPSELADLQVRPGNALDDGESWLLSHPEFPADVTVEFAAEGQLPLALVRQSARVLDGAAELSLRATGLVQQFLLLHNACMLLELPCPVLPLPASSTEPPDARELFAYYAPARPDYQDRPPPQLRPGDRLRLSFEVPSRCGHQCVFCVAWQECGAEQFDLSADALLAAARELLASLDQALPPGTTTDLVLVGQDALSHDRFEELTGLFREAGHVQRIAVVTPGTRLAKPGVARHLKEAGLDVAILTLLATDGDLHDRLTGRPGAFSDVRQAMVEMTAAGLDWELNSVLLKDNVDRFPDLLEYVRSLGKTLRVYLYTSEPMVPLEQARGCAPDMAGVSAMLASLEPGLQGVISSLHYAPLCLLPEWARPLASHASQSLPAPADPLPAACRNCPALGSRCPSISEHHRTLFGEEGLHPVKEA